MIRSIEIGVLVAVAILFFLIGKDSSPVSDKHEVDSLANQIRVIKQQDQEFVDSVYRDALERDAVIKSWEDKYEEQKAKVKKSTPNIERYEIAKVTDTVTAIKECDTIITELAIYKQEAEKTIEDADTIISLQEGQIMNYQTAADRLRSDLDSTSRNALIISDKYDILYKKRNNWWNKWGSKAAAFILGAFIISTINK